MATEGEAPIRVNRWRCECTRMHSGLHARLHYKSFYLLFTPSQIVKEGQRGAYMTYVKDWGPI